MTTPITFIATTGSQPINEGFAPGGDFARYIGKTMNISPQLRVLAGAFCISFSAVFVRLVDVPATTSGFYRVFIGGLGLAVLVALTRTRLAFSRGSWFVLVVCSLFFAADLWFWHRSIIYVGPGLSTLLASLQVIFVTLFGALLLGLKPTRRQLIAIPIALLGLCLIVGIDWNALPVHYRLGVVFGILTAVSYAGYLLSLRHVQAETRSKVPLAELAVMTVLTTVWLAICALFEGESLAVGSWSNFSWLLAYGLLAHIVGWLLITSAIAEVSPAVFGLSLLIQPVLSFAWDILFFGRGLTWIEALGGFITLVAILIGGARTARHAGTPPGEAQPRSAMLK